MTTFTRAELRGLDPQDLADLIGLAEGSTPFECAQSLGLDPTNPNDRKAVEAAVAVRWPGEQSFSPPIGAGEEGVRSDLTPADPQPATPDTGEGDDSTDALGLPQPDPEAAADMAELLRISSGTGKPFMAGTFAMYSDPSGAVVLVTEDQAGNVRRSVIPTKAVSFALGLMAGKRPGGMLGRLLFRG